MGHATNTRLHVLLLVTVWLALRVVFFEGLWGYDDLDHIGYAMAPEPPRDVFQARLLLNGMLWAVHGLFGAAEWVWALPTMAASLAFVLATYFTARRLLTPGEALLAGLLAATLVLDVTTSTDPGGSPLANAFAAVGTGLLLTGEGRRRLGLAGVFLAGGMIAHLATALYVLPVVVAWALHDPARRRWREAALLFGVVSATWLVVDCAVFTVAVGDPLGHYRLLVGTHLTHQPYHDVPPRLASGALNPEFFGWSFRALVFTKHFGFLLALPLAWGLWRWRRLERAGRLLVLLLALGWLYLNFGSQHPLAWAPLGKSERYWYPLALPACLLAVRAARDLRPWLRRAWHAALWVPVAPLLLMAGPWGQNVEISRELAAFAEAHPERRFVTDPHTWDEMYLLGGRRAPVNVAVLDDGRPDLRASVAPPRVRPAALVDYEALVNPMHLHRERARPFAARVAGRAPVTPPTWRVLARVLPPDVRERYPALQRKPPAEVGRFR